LSASEDDLGLFGKVLLIDGSVTIESVSKQLALALTDLDLGESDQDIVSNFFYQGGSFQDLIESLEPAFGNQPDIFFSLCARDWSQISLNEAIDFIRELSRDILKERSKPNFSIDKLILNRVDFY